MMGNGKVDKFIAAALIAVVVEDGERRRDR